LPGRWQPFRAQVLPDHLLKGTLAGDMLAIAVSPGHRGKGFGRLLLQRVIEICGQVAGRAPVRALRLSVADTNARAQVLFASFGFCRLKGDFGRYDGGQHLLRMERPIGP
jgi:ribosomal protein S18 acetylase RimI-like enzyme